MLALSEFALRHTHVKNHVSYKKIHHQIIKYIHEPLGWPFIHLTVRLLRLMTARAKSTWPLNLTTASFVFDGDVGVIDVLEVYMTSSVFSFSYVFLFLQHCRYLTFKKVFDERNREEQKKASEMDALHTPTCEMDRLAHDGGTWKQIGICRRIEGPQGFLQGGRTYGVWRVPLRAEGMDGKALRVGSTFMKNVSDEPFFLRLKGKKEREAPFTSILMLLKVCCLPPA